MSTIRFQRPDPTKSVARAKLEDRLREGKVGDTITNADLEKIIGCDPRSPKGYRITAAAMNYVSTHEGRTWGRVHKADMIQCFDPRQVDRVSNSSRERIGRIATRTCSKIQNVLAMADLETQRSLLTHSAAFGVIAAQAGVKMHLKKGTPANQLDTKALGDSFAT